MRERTFESLTVLSTAGSRYFAERLAARLPGSRLVGTDRKHFGDGERYLRIALDNRMGLIGKDVIFVASTTTDDDLAEVCRVGAAAAKYGARRVVYVIPFFGYSTMERAVKPGEVVAAKTIARQLSAIPAGDLRNAFLMLDLHTGGLVHYFEGECLRFELYAEPVLAEVIHGLRLKNFMFGSADLGRPKWVESFAKRFGTELAFVRQTRDFEDKEAHEVIGDVAGKTVVIYDDMTRKATSLKNATRAYREKGAAEVYAVLSHLALNSPEIVDVLEDLPIAKIITTNSHPMSQLERVQFSDKFIVKDVVSLFEEAIRELDI